MNILPRIGNGLVWTVSVDGNILFDAVGDIALALALEPDSVVE